MKVGARTGTVGYSAYSWVRCRVDAGQGAASLTKLTGSQRPVGRIFPDNAKRQIFLGTLELGEEKFPMDYGSDRRSDKAGLIERYGVRRARSVMTPHPLESVGQDRMG